MNKQIVYALIIVAVIQFIKWLIFRNGDKIPDVCSYMFTGCMGSGKTYLSTLQATRIINRRLIKYRLVKIFPFLAYVFPSWQNCPRVYSTYPIVEYYRRCSDEELDQMKQARAEAKKEYKALKFKDRMQLRKGGYKIPKVTKKIPVFFPPLEFEHIIGQKRCEEGSVWVISEAGRLLPQWDFNNPVVCEEIAHTVALSRHFFNGVIIFDDQCSDNLVKAVRCRLGMIYHLHHFRRMWGILPYFKVNYVPLLPVEDNNTTVASDAESWFYGPLPYKWQRNKKKYESRCYKPLYTSKAEKYIEQFDGFYTTYMMNIAVNKEMMKLYKDNKRLYKELFLYDKKWRFNVDKSEFEEIPENETARENETENERTA